MDVVVTAAAKEELRISYIKSEKQKIKDVDGQQKLQTLSEEEERRFVWLYKQRRIKREYRLIDRDINICPVCFRLEI